ncbi:MAG TPA: LamG domain-containing protein [Solirubrobacteraceae bacterium]|nr:LamG domain-containing protein [Solirubrobacteraceae bacterium]
MLSLVATAVPVAAAEPGAGAARHRKKGKRCRGPHGKAKKACKKAKPRTEAKPPERYLQFDGAANYVEAPDSTALSVDATGSLSVSVWMRPDALTFIHTEGSLPSEQYVHWLGKGGKGQSEWVFRMYSVTNPPGPRENRISFYVFNLTGGRGCGSYFQDPVQTGRWIHVVGVVDGMAQTTSIYKNGVLRNTNSYAGIITPRHGAAPLRLGTQDLASFSQGALAQVDVWNRVLTANEIAKLHTLGTVPRGGLAAEYKLNEGAGSTAFDTASGNNGVVFGATWGMGSYALQTDTGSSGGGC